MDPTTLITFFFKASPHIRSVELFGSWDNFQLPYSMQHDRRRGVGYWSGYFKFENIIFDGDKLQWSRPRTGGLKQGGTYWYYYRLNNSIEAYDDSAAYTTDCPLVPGQIVNVIEVPREIIRAPTRTRSAYGDLLGTLASVPEAQTQEPTKKFEALEPAQFSKYYNKSKSDDALHRILRERDEPTTQSPGNLDGLPELDYKRSSISSDELSLVSETSLEQTALYSRHGPDGCRSDGYSMDAVLNAYASSSSASLIDPDEIPLPSFPYPSVLGAAPITSTDELCGSLFPQSHSTIIPVTVDIARPVSAEPRTSSLHPALVQQTASTLAVTVPERRCSSSHSPKDITYSPKNITCSPKDITRSPKDITRSPKDIGNSPISVQNVQFYGGTRPSSPGSASSSTKPASSQASYGHRMYSLPNLSLQSSHPPSEAAQSRSEEDVSSHATLEVRSSSLESPDCVSPPGLLTPTRSSVCSLSSTGDSMLQRASTTKPAPGDTWDSTLPGLTAETDSVMVREAGVSLEITAEAVETPKMATPKISTPTTPKAPATVTAQEDASPEPVNALAILSPASMVIPAAHAEATPRTAIAVETPAATAAVEHKPAMPETSTPKASPVLEHKPAPTAATPKATAALTPKAAVTPKATQKAASKMASKVASKVIPLVTPRAKARAKASSQTPTPKAQAIKVPTPKTQPPKAQTPKKTTPKKQTPKKTQSPDKQTTPAHKASYDIIPRVNVLSPPHSASKSTTSPRSSQPGMTTSPTGVRKLLSIHGRTHPALRNTNTLSDSAVNVPLNPSFLAPPPRQDTRPARRRSGAEDEDGFFAEMGYLGASIL